jgi:hypothetical protein
MLRISSGIRNSFGEDPFKLTLPNKLGNYGTLPDGLVYLNFDLINSILLIKLSTQKL